MVWNPLFCVWVGFGNSQGLVEKSSKASIYVFWERSGCNLNQENFPIFDHTHYPDLRTDFWVINKGNLEVSPSGKL